MYDEIRKLKPRGNKALAQSKPASKRQAVIRTTLKITTLHWFKYLCLKYLFIPFWKNSKGEMDLPESPEYQKYGFSFQNPVDFGHLFTEPGGHSSLPEQPEEGEVRRDRGRPRVSMSEVQGEQQSSLMFYVSISLSKCAFLQECRLLFIVSHLNQAHGTLLKKNTLIFRNNFLNRIIEISHFSYSFYVLSVRSSVFPLFMFSSCCFFFDKHIHVLCPPLFLCSYKYLINL